MSLWAFSERYISFALRQHLHCLVIFVFIDIKQVNQTSLAVLFSSHGPSWISQYIIVNRISLYCVRTAVILSYLPFVFHCEQHEVTRCHYVRHTGWGFQVGRLVCLSVSLCERHNSKKFWTDLGVDFVRVEMIKSSVPHPTGACTSSRKYASPSHRLT